MDAGDFQRWGLYDPDGEDAEERLALLRFLSEHGVPPEEMVEADREGWLPYAAFRHGLRRGPPLTLREVAAHAGLPVEKAADIWRTVGFPHPDEDAAIFTEAHVELFRTLAFAEGLLGSEVTTQVSRVIGSSLARIAEAELQAYATNVAAPLIQEEGEVAVARANTQVAALMPLLAKVFEVLHLDHIDSGIRRLAQTVDAIRGGAETTTLAIAFLDLVGFTGLSGRISDQQLGSLVSELEARAGELIATRGGRLVKMIGDEVMFVTRDAASACEIALALSEEFSEERGLPGLRGGLAFGPVLARHGDYYGPVVNLASRLVGAAQPGSVFVDDSVRREVEALHEGLHFEPVGAQALKGFDEEVALYRLTRSRATQRG